MQILQHVFNCEEGTKLGEAARLIKPTAMCRILISNINDGKLLAEEKKQLEDKCRDLWKAEGLGRTEKMPTTSIACWVQ